MSDQVLVSLSVLADFQLGAERLMAALASTREEPAASRRDLATSQATVEALHVSLDEVRARHREAQQATSPITLPGCFLPCPRCGPDGPLEAQLPECGWKPGLVMSELAKAWFFQAGRRHRAGTLGQEPLLGEVPQPEYVPCPVCQGTTHGAPVTTQTVREWAGATNSARVILAMCDLLEGVAAPCSPAPGSRA